MFAGPNGGGKTTLIEIIAKKYSIGIFLNADRIAQRLDDKPFLDLREFGLKNATQEDFVIFAGKYENLKARLKKTFEELQLQIEEGYIIKKSEFVNSYEAAFVADFIRDALLKNKKGFSFETVMSHRSKINFIQEAGQAGFKTYLYYIAASDPEIHSQRVKERVNKGGHGVPEEKIHERYYRSLDLLYDAVKMADRTFIIDNSTKEGKLVAEKDNKSYLELKTQSVPWWVDEYLLQKIEED